MTWAIGWPLKSHKVLLIRRPKISILPLGPSFGPQVQRLKASPGQERGDHCGRTCRPDRLRLSPDSIEGFAARLAPRDSDGACTRFHSLTCLALSHATASDFYHQRFALVCLFPSCFLLSALARVEFPRLASASLCFRVCRALRVPDAPLVFPPHTAFRCAKKAGPHPEKALLD